MRSGLDPDCAKAHPDVVALGGLLNCSSHSLPAKSGMLPVLRTRSGNLPDFEEVPPAFRTDPDRLATDGDLNGQAPRMDQPTRVDPRRSTSDEKRLASQVQLADHPRTAGGGTSPRSIQSRASGAQGSVCRPAKAAAVPILHCAVGKAARAPTRSDVGILGWRRCDSRERRTSDRPRSPSCHSPGRLRLAGRERRTAARSVLATERTWQAASSVSPPS